MNINLLHNKIIKDTVTEKFISAFQDRFIPKLTEKYGSQLSDVQMYEDCISDNFISDGYFFYPLTLKVGGETVREWIMWDISEPRDFADSVPFAYVGEGELDILFAENVPEGFNNALRHRASFFEGGYVTFKIQSVSDSKTFLSGKYSQTFIDELTRQISKKIEKLYNVTGIEDSGVELTMVFSPGTYMEHIVENTTYRRLLITARGCAPRDFWIKWTNKRGPGPLTVSDNVTFDDILFDIGEDVPQKIREKEYRFLVHSSADKYQQAMGRRNITEWRDVIKRVIRRGELIKLEASEPENELKFKLGEVLAVPENTQTAPAEEAAVEQADNSDLTALLKSVLGQAEDVPETDTDETSNEFEDLPPFDSFDIKEVETPEASEEDAGQAISDEVSESKTYSEPDKETDMEELRKKIEAEIRERLENEVREKAEAEAERLRAEHAALLEENERLAALARQAEEERAQEAEKHRLEIEAREAAERREKERLAEAARLAILEQKRLAEEDREKERLKKEAEEQRQREAEETRIEAERAAEKARIEAEIKAKEEAERQDALSKAEEEKRNSSGYHYTSKNVRLLFRNAVDPNVTKRIHEIILSTIKYFHKENVYIKIKASIPDRSTVNLHFTEIPEGETELLVKIIKVLGNSELGIVKAFLE